MRKRFLVALLVLAMVGLTIPLGYCSEINWFQVDKDRQLNKVMPGYLQSAGTAFGGSTSITTTGIAVPLSYSVVYKSIASATAISNDATFGTGTLANGTPGQLLRIFISEIVAGDAGTWTLTPTTMTGFASLVFNAANDEVTLLYVDSTTGWILISSTSVTVTFPTAELNAL